MQQLITTISWTITATERQAITGMAHSRRAGHGLSWPRAAVAGPCPAVTMAVGGSGEHRQEHCSARRLTRRQRYAKTQVRIMASESTGGKPRASVSCYQGS